MRRIGELPFVVAVREALPWSFIGLVAAFVVILAVELQRRHAAERFARAAPRVGASSCLRGDGDRVGRRSAAAPRAGVRLWRLAVTHRKRRRFRARAPAPVRPRRDLLSATPRRLGTLRRDLGLRRRGSVDRVGAAVVARAAFRATPARCWGSARSAHSSRCISRCRRRLRRRCTRSRDWATRTSR